MILPNVNNYGPYVDLARDGFITVKTDDINIGNWNSHLKAIENIMRDGLETDFVQNMNIEVIFNGGGQVELSIMDYFYNLILWRLIIVTGNPVTSYHLFYEDSITKATIKRYIDEKFIRPYRETFTNIEINNIIDESLYQFTTIDAFSFYLMNTINLEDDIELMKKYPEYHDLMHTDLSGVPVEDVKKIGSERTQRAIDYIMNSDHSLADSFRAKEGVNPKQYREYAINIGSKPDGSGDIFPVDVNNSFLNGGVNNLQYLFIESSVGRVAQIITKMNVGSSGSFARLLNLNTRDTVIHQDPHYVCDSKNFQIIFVRDENYLRVFENRYYRSDPHGMEYVIGPKDTHLIGTTIYLRSPMTCSSASRNKGVCYRCYGKLANTNCDINIGILASELLSAELTQRLLSAKHLLESIVKKLEWTKAFYDHFDVDFNVITLNENINFKGYKLIIDPAKITLQSEDDYAYNEYIESFEIELPDGKRLPIYTSDSIPIYISTDLNDMIRKFGDPSDGMIEIDLAKLKYKNVFLINIMNNEISKALDDITSILNKSSETSKYDRHELLQMLVHYILEGGLHLNAIHAEIILSCQIRNSENILIKPRWELREEDCDILTLNRALTDNPSVTISMLYQKLDRALYNPLTFKKNAASFLDLLFMEKPQEFMSNMETLSGNRFRSDKEEQKSMISIVEEEK